MIEKQDREEGWVLPAGGTDAGEAGDIARGPGFNLIQILKLAKKNSTYIPNIRHFELGGGGGGGVKDLTLRILLTLSLSYIPFCMHLQVIFQCNFQT